MKFQMGTDVMHDELADYIARGRSAVSIPGAEPVFVQRGNAAFVILHGWCATAESVRFLTAGITAGGYSVLAPTLPGHGTSPVDIINYGPLDWIRAAREAVSLMGRHFQEVHLIGTSMGGTLALQLAALESSIVRSVTTVNAPVFLSNPELAIDVMNGPPEEPLPRWIPAAFMGPSVTEITYSQRARKTGQDLLTMATLANEVLTLIKSPLLVVQSRHDPVVPSKCADQIMTMTSSTIKQLAWLDNSYHASQLDNDRNKIVSIVLKFVTDLDALAGQ